MKKIFLSVAAPLLLALSSYTFAAKVIISGQPVNVIQAGTVYTVPTTSTYTTKSDYYYVSVGNEKRVCYREAQPSLASVNLMNINLKVGSDTVAVHCYTYTPEYFEVK